MITLKDIEVKRHFDAKRGQIEYDARLKLTNRHVIPESALIGIDEAEMENIVYHNLRMSILAHIYGDLIEPINVMARLLNKNCEDYDEINEAKEVYAKIQRLIQGEKEPSLIFTPG